MLSQVIGYIFLCPVNLNFYWITHVSLIQNDNYQQIPDKMKNNGGHEKKDSINIWVS